MIKNSNSKRFLPECGHLVPEQLLGCNYPGLAMNQSVQICRFCALRSVVNSGLPAASTVGKLRAGGHSLLLIQRFLHCSTSLVDFCGS